MIYRALSAAAIVFAIAQPATAQDLVPYDDAPDIPTPFTHIAKYAPVLEASVGPSIDPDKGYRVQDLGNGAYMVTEGVYQILVLRTREGLVIADAPPNLGPHILQATEEIAPGAPITHLIYSHSHIDHIGFAAQIVATNPEMEIVAHSETAETLARRTDPNRPLPTATFDETMEPFELTTGGETLVLNYPGPNHQNGNIEIWHETSRTLMLIDVVFPGWMMWRDLALAEDVPGIFDVITSINERYDFDTLIAGHVGRAGTKADVELQIEFLTDLHNAAGQALGTTTPGEGVDPADFVNPWAVFDNFLVRVIVKCVATMAPKWQNRLSAFEVFIYEQCSTMEQSLRVDGPSL